MENIGRQIRQIREKYNLSQERFGNKVGVTGKAISAYETERSSPPLKIIEKISDEYDASFLHLKEEKQADLELKIQQIKDSLSEIEEIIVKT